MKKLFALVLVIVMFLNLIGCNGNTTQTGNNLSKQEQNNTKEDYEVNTDNIDLVGTWKNITSDGYGEVITFNKNGTGTFGSHEFPMTWEQNTYSVACTINESPKYSQTIHFNINTNNGIVELTRDSDGGYYIYISEQDYQNKIECIEITLENWQQYFEIKQYVVWLADDALQICNALSPTDEYIDRFTGAGGIVEGSFSGIHYYPVEYNTVTRELVLGEPLTDNEAQGIGLFSLLADKPHTFSVRMSSHTEYGINKKDVKLFGGAFDGHDIFEKNGDIVNTYCMHYDNIEITNIECSICLRK